MKYRSGGSTPPKPPQPTAAERAADAKFRKSVKDLKPTPEQAAAIGRANRSSGYAKGGNVKKMAIGGIPAGASTTVLRPPIMSGSPNAPTMQPVTSGGRVANTRTAAVSRRAEGGTAKAAKGGKAKAKSFAATKFGAAMMKKSADTKGRAMPKFAKGGSIDGCAVKGKTKTSMIKMKKGGSC